VSFVVVFGLADYYSASWSFIIADDACVRKFLKLKGFGGLLLVNSYTTTNFSSL